MTRHDDVRESHFASEEGGVGDQVRVVLVQLMVN